MDLGRLLQKLLLEDSFEIIRVKLSQLRISSGFYGIVNDFYRQIFNLCSLFLGLTSFLLGQVSNIFSIPDQHKSSTKDNVKLSRSNLLSNKIHYHKIV
jgi:hypothetical protein